MNRPDLTHDDHGDAAVRVAPPLFGQEITVSLFPDLDGGDRVSEKMLAAARDVERLGAEHRAALASMLHGHAELCLETTSYGYVWPGEGEDPTEANRDAFGVRTPDEAFAAAGLPEAHVSGDDDDRASRFAVLTFYPPWEDEHGCGIVLRDGVPVGWGSADAYVGRYDEDERDEDERDEDEREDDEREDDAL